MNNLAINGGKQVIEENLNDEWQDIRQEDIKKVKEYLENEPISVIDGGILTKFEKCFAEFVNAKYAVAYCNGTAALHAASYACGANKNNNFIISEYSYHGTVNSLLENNTKVFLCDYDKDTLNVDADSIEKCINKDTKGIVITHCWGNPVQMDKIKKLREKYNLRSISDASHAHGAKCDKKEIGGLNCEDIACFSLGKNKLISAGELGVAVTNSKELYDELLFFGHPNRVPDALITDKYKSYINGIGNKYRPHPLSMVLAVEQLKRYKEKKALNIKTNNYLAENIGKIPGFVNIKTYEKAERVYWKLLIKIDKTYWEDIPLNRIAEALNKEGVKLEQFHNYNIKAHEHIWEHERYAGQIENKSTMNAPDDILVLPGYIKLEKNTMDLIIKCFKKVSNNKGELK